MYRKSCLMLTPHQMQMSYFPNSWYNQMTLGSSKSLKVLAFLFHFIFIKKHMRECHCHLAEVLHLTKALIHFGFVDEVLVDVDGSL